MLNDWQNERIKAWLRYKAETLKRSNREKCLRDAVGSVESAGERGRELAHCRLAGCLLFWSSVSPPGLPARRGFPWLTSTHTHTHTPFTVTSKSTHIVNPTLWTPHTLELQIKPEISLTSYLSPPYSVSLSPDHLLIYIYMETKKPKYVVPS